MLVGHGLSIDCGFGDQIDGTSRGSDVVDDAAEPLQLLVRERGASPSELLLPRAVVVEPISRKRTGTTGEPTGMPVWRLIPPTAALVEIIHC